jgi:hypothetical protein
MFGVKNILNCSRKIVFSNVGKRRPCWRLFQAPGPLCQKYVFFSEETFLTLNEKFNIHNNSHRYTESLQDLREVFFGQLQSESGAQ